MLKIKDDVDLKKLEKYGFIQEPYSNNDYIYKIDLSEYLEIKNNKQIKLYIDDEYYCCYSGEITFDKLYDLIKDGLVTKID